MEAAQLPVAQLEESSMNFFRPMSEQELSELAASIKELGILHPLVVRRVGDKYKVISGHQRLRAARLLGMETVPCRIVEATDAEAEAMLIDSNLQTRALNPMEKARAIRRRKELAGIRPGRPDGDNPATVAGLARDLGMSERSLMRYDSLNDLIPELQDLVSEGSLSVSLAERLASLPRDAQSLIWQALGDSISSLSGEELKRLRRENERSHAAFQEVLREMQEARKKAEELEGLYGQKEALEREIRRLQQKKRELEYDVDDRQNAAKSLERRLANNNLALLEVVERLGKAVQAERPNIVSWLGEGLRPSIAPHILRWAGVLKETGSLLEQHALEAMREEVKYRA